jgi:hypothetical protein
MTRRCGGSSEQGPAEAARTEMREDGENQRLELGGSPLREVREDCPLRPVEGVVLLEFWDLRGRRERAPRVDDECALREPPSRDLVAGGEMDALEIVGKCRAR